MRRNLSLIALTVLVTAASIFLIATACSWDILTRGEIHDDETQISQSEDPPGDSLETLDFIEMEVGELECDTIPEDTTATP